MNAPGQNSPRRNAAPRRLRRWLPYAGALALAALAAAGFWPSPEPVETARASVGALRATVNEEGKTRIRQRFVLAAPVTGRLRRIALKAGAVVSAGRTLVAVIDPPSPDLLDARRWALAQARRDAAAANFDKARAAHDYAANDLRRIEKLYASQTLSPQERDAAQWREAAAAKEEAAARSDLREAEAELGEFGVGALADADPPDKPVEMKAPVSGRILRVFEESARPIAAGAPLVEIGDPSDLEVVVDVLSRDAAVIRPGDKVELDQWGGPKPLAARVRSVEPEAFTKVSALGVEEQRVNVIADLLTPPEQRRGLGDNFRVEARIVIWEDPRAIKVPSGALFRHKGRWSVFVLDGGRVQLRPVEVGHASDTETQIVSGLQPGEEVVVYPSERIHDGQRVKRIQI